MHFENQFTRYAQPFLSCGHRFGAKINVECYMETTRLFVNHPAISGISLIKAVLSFITLLLLP